MKCFIHGGQEVGRGVLVEHHKWPTGFGGPDEPDNIILICASCHDLLHKIAEALFHGKEGKAKDLASQYLPNDPKRRQELLKFSGIVATKKREYYDNYSSVPENPDDERDIILSLSIPQSLHSRLKTLASDTRQGLYRYCVGVLDAHVKTQNMGPSMQVPEQDDLV